MPARSTRVAYRRNRTRADDAYHRLLRELWAAGEDFVIVEHDFVVDADDLRLVCRTLMCERGRIMRAGGRVHCLISVPTPRLDSVGRCRCVFRCGESPVLAV